MYAIMNKKHVIALLVAALLLIGTSSATAAKAGSAQDPLISQSYVQGQFSSGLISQAKVALNTAIGNLEEKHQSIIESGSLSTGRFKMEKLSDGENVSLKMGGSFVLLEGSASLKILFGHIINVSRGELVESGAVLTAGNRYLAAEYTLAVLTSQGVSNVALDGDSKKGEIANTFSDVPVSHWAFAYVEDMAGRSIVNGKGGGLFDPSSDMIRADFVTVLGRLAGIDVNSFPNSPFSDVSIGLYYSPYISWASENGLVMGYGDGRFGPMDKITRAQMASVMISFAKSVGIQIPQSSQQPFADDSDIPAWAKADVYAARSLGLITGREGNIFASAANANRAEVCTVISRLIGLI